MREPESRAGALLESIVLDRHCSHREDGRTARRDGGATRAGLAVVAPVFFLHGLVMRHKPHPGMPPR